MPLCCYKTTHTSAMEDALHTWCRARPCFRTVQAEPRALLLAWSTVARQEGSGGRRTLCLQTELPGGPGSRAWVPQTQPCPLIPCSCRVSKGMLLPWVWSGEVGGAPAVTGAVELPDRTSKCIIDEAVRPAPLNARRKEMSSAPH